MMIFLLAIFNLIVFAPMFKGLIPLPTDALAGSYYPWLGQNWGFAAGIPFKNISLTDVFSQLYPWRALAVDLIRSGHLPLWNQFSASGMPLLANWQSAPFYPLNVLMLIFGNMTGYGLLVFLQPILASIFMYLFLRQLKLSKIASTLGALVSAYSGFAMVYLEYATIGQIMLWLPLILLFIGKYFETKKVKFLIFTSLGFFPVLTGGFFQPAFYVILIVSLYWLLRSLAEKGNKTKLIILGITFILIGILTAAVQLIPTLELFKYSIRNLDHNIVEYNFGLLPIRNLFSLLAPDFFGNPVTGNYWGVIQYQEVTGYFSTIALILSILAIFSKKRNWRINLFAVLFIGSLILAFDNPISRLIYQFKLPLLSTGYASRWLVVTAFSGAFLGAIGLENINFKKFTFLVGGFLSLLILTYLSIWKGIIPVNASYIPVITRNLILPIGILGVTILLSLFIKNKKIAGWILLGLVAFDLGRFTIKFTPFSKPEYTQRPLPIFEYIKSQTSIDRVITQDAPIMPANTWMYPRIFSPTGYDPLTVKDYATFFHGLNGTNFDDGIYTRYLHLSKPNSPLIDLTGSKYLIAVKYDPQGNIRPWGELDRSTIDPNRYKQVFEDGETVVLENISVMPRASLFYSAETEMDTLKAAEKLANGYDFRKSLLINKENPSQYTPDASDSVEITNYSANKIEFKVKTQNGAYLLLTDTFYPGWQVTVNNQKEEILRADTSYRAVEVPPGESTIVMSYSPTSFRVGAIISVVSILTLIGLLITQEYILAQKRQ